MRKQWFKDNVELYPNTPIRSVVKLDDLYEVTTHDGKKFQSPVPPLMAGGFDGSHKLVADLFEKRDDGFPLLSEDDESTIVPGMFLCGPTVRHQNHVFCFIYKFRQAFCGCCKNDRHFAGITRRGVRKNIGCGGCTWMTSLAVVRSVYAKCQW